MINKTTLNDFLNILVDIIISFCSFQRKYSALLGSIIEVDNKEKI